MPVTPSPSEGVALVAPVGAWMEFGCSALEAISTHAFRWNPEDCRRYSQEMKTIVEGLQKEPNAAALLVAAQTVKHRVEEYSGNTQRQVDGSIAELRDIVRILLSFAEQSQGEGDDSAGALEQMREMVGKTATADELRTAKVNLDEALQGLAEKQRQRNATAEELAVNLGEQALSPEQSIVPGTMPFSTTKSTTTRPAAEEALDVLTGLPGRGAAEIAIWKVQANPGNAYLAAFFVQRMAHFNARLGDKIGNELLFLTAQAIANALLRPGDQMFRWQGPAFLAILRREESLLDVKRETTRIFGARFQFEMRGGSMLVTPAVVTEVLSTGTGAYADLMQQLESFFSRPSTCGY